MKITRPLVTFLFATCSFLPLSFVGSARKPAAGTHYLAFVGTYTNNKDSKGIYAFDFDAAAGKLTPKGLAATTPNPSWLVVHPNGRFVYAANESGKQSTITAFSIDETSSKLNQLNQVPALGEDPCHLSIDKIGKYLFVANYSSGNVVVFPILPDGRLGEHTANVKDVGTLGPNKKRQEGPHAHWVQVSPDNRFLLVADLGLDAILSYRFDATKGTLTPNSPPFTKLAAGAGPRHAVFSGSGKSFFVLSELDSTVTGFSYDPVTGALRRRSALSTLPVGSHGRNDAAEIALLPVGKSSECLLVSNRGFDGIAITFVDPDKADLGGPASFFPSGGKEPRHFAIDPTGHFLLTENQNSNTITVFRIDPPVLTFPLAKVSEVEVPSPVCLAFYHGQ